MLVPFWLADFAEWPVASTPGQFSGTFWTDTVGPCTIAADASFFSGHVIRWANPTGSSLYTFQPHAAGSQVYQWNFVRVADYNRPASPGVTGGTGWQFETGVADNYVRINPDTQALGVGNRYLLQVRSGAVGTFATLATSPNSYPAGAKTSMALALDAATGTLTWTINNVVIYSAIYAPFVGMGFTAMRFGRQDTEPGNGTFNTGDLFAYTGSAYVGPAEVRSGFPNADGPDQDWAQNGGAGSGFSCINGTYVAVPVNFISSPTSGDVSNFGAAVSNTNVFAVFGAAIGYYAERTDITPVDMNGWIGDGGFYTAGATVDPPEGTYQQFYDFWGPINPNSGIAWTPADVAGAEIEFDRLT